jgi:hypothetical protein
MYFVRHLTLLVAAGLTALASVPLATALEPNNTPATSTVLPGGQWLVGDSLNGNVGRPNTLLGLFSPGYVALQASDDNSSPLGNNFASQLVSVPMRSDGSIYFRVSGSPDATYIGNHTQSGKYAWYLDVRDQNGQIVPTLSQFQNDEISPFAMDNIWLDPMISPDPLRPNWEGYTVDMTLNNVIGPGTGDSLDFFTFTGLAAFQSFEVKLTSDFAGLIGQYSGNTRIASSIIGSPIPTIIGLADAGGNVKIGVTGAADTNFTGAHIAAGQFTLQLIVPEPTGAISLGIGAALVGCYGIRKRSRRGSQSVC